MLIVISNCVCVLSMMKQCIPMDHIHIEPGTDMVPCIEHGTVKRYSADKRYNADKKVHSGSALVVIILHTNSH